MKKIKNIFQNKVLLMRVGAVMLFLVAAGGSFVYLNAKNAPFAKMTTTAISPTTTAAPAVVTTAKQTATTDDVQADLNGINAKSSNLDNEISGASSGLSDQQTNLTY